jgi:hypothetical protein
VHQSGSLWSSAASGILRIPPVFTYRQMVCVRTMDDRNINGMLLAETPSHICLQVLTDKEDPTSWKVVQIPTAAYKQITMDCPLASGMVFLETPDGDSDGFVNRAFLSFDNMLRWEPFYKAVLQDDRIEDISLQAVITNHTAHVFSPVSLQVHRSHSVSLHTCEGRCKQLSLTRCSWHAERADDIPGCLPRACRRTCVSRCLGLFATLLPRLNTLC